MLIAVVNAVRVYVIKAQNLMPVDFNGLADPFLRVLG